MDLKTLFLTAGLMASVCINLYAGWYYRRQWKNRFALTLYRIREADKIGMQMVLPGQPDPYWPEAPPTITEIIVPSEHARDELLKFSRYLHLLPINTEYAIVNTMAHLKHLGSTIRVVPTPHRCAADHLPD